MITTQTSEGVEVALDIKFERVYSSTAVVQVTGLTYRQIDHWERQRVLGPSVREASGPGSKRRYSTEDVRTLAVLSELANGGARLATLRAVVHEVRAALRSSTRWLIVGPDGWVDACDDDGAVALCLDANDVAGAWVIDIERVIDRLILDEDV